MKADRNRKPGFYWVRFEGEVIVAEYTDGAECIDTSVDVVPPHWHMPGSPDCFKNAEVCELLSGRLALEKSS